MRYKWYRLDNSAIVYQMVITPYTQSIYRIGAKLDGDVDEAALRKAVNTALVRYPFFKSELKRGFFRPYLDENKASPVVEQDDGVLLKIFNFRHNHYFLFRTTYYGKRIFIDFFHGLCDGSGALNFFKTVLYYYYKEKNIPFPSDNILTLDVPVSDGESEDAFDKYFTKIKLFRGIKSMAGGNAFGICGKQFRNPGFGLIQATVSTQKLLEASRAHSCSVTVFVTALILLAVAESKVTAPLKNSLIAFIPVNLRKRFPSGTLGNFTVFAKCIIPKETPFELDALVFEVKKSLTEQLSPDELQLKLSFTSLLAKMPLFRYMPLFLKSYISRIGRSLGTKPKQTFIISNLGKVELGENARIDHFLFNLNCGKKTPDNIGIITYKDKTVISFTRKIISTDIERLFCSKLEKMCGNVEVISNFREECDAL